MRTDLINRYPEVRSSEPAIPDLQVCSVRYEGPAYAQPCTVHTLQSEARQYVVRCFDDTPGEAIFLHCQEWASGKWQWLMFEHIPYEDPAFRRAVSHLHDDGYTRIQYFIDGFYPVELRKTLQL